MNDGIQPHSRGPLYPWVWTEEYLPSTGWSSIYYKHPDGRCTVPVSFKDSRGRAKAEKVARARVELQILVGGERV